MNFDHWPRVSSLKISRRPPYQVTATMARLATRKRKGNMTLMNRETRIELRMCSSATLPKRACSLFSRT